MYSSFLVVDVGPEKCLKGRSYRPVLLLELLHHKWCGFTEGGGGLVVLNWRSNAEGAGWRDGWKKKEKRRGGCTRRLWVTHRHFSSLPLDPSFLTPPLCRSLHLLGAIQWMAWGFTVPSPIPNTLNHTHSASNSVTLMRHIAAYHSWLKSTFCCMVESWCKVQTCFCSVNVRHWTSDLNEWRHSK